MKRPPHHIADLAGGINRLDLLRPALVLPRGTEIGTHRNPIQRIAAERTVVLVEHKMKLVMGICERLVVLHHGELLAEGTPAEIRNNEDVKRVYLGQ